MSEDKKSHQAKRCVGCDKLAKKPEQKFCTKCGEKYYDCGDLRLRNVRGVATKAADSVPIFISSAGELGTAQSALAYKENIADIFDTSFVYDFRPVSFNYIGQDKPQVGLIAEEVDPIYPDMTIWEPDYDANWNQLSTQHMLTLDYNRLPILLLSELKKLRARVAALEAI